MTLDNSDELNDLNKSNKLFIFVIISLVTFVSMSHNDIETNYELCNYNIITVMIQLAINNNSAAVYLDTNCEVVLIDDLFFETQLSNANIHTIITSLQIKEIELNKHYMFKYLILKIFFLRKKEIKIADLAVIK